MKKWLLILICILVIVPMAISATYYMPDDCGNINECMDIISGGDTLIIRDGMYTGRDNMFTWGSFPPAGTSDNYTMIKAEHPGKVILGDSSTTDSYIYLSGLNNLYCVFDGIVSLNPIGVIYTNYVKFLRCGIDIASNTGNVSFYTNNTDYILCEDCYAWGGGRYKFLGYLSDHIIFRRCVGRVGAVDTTHSGRTEPIGVFALYHTSNSEVQNCIGIDSDTNAYWIYSGLAGVLTNPNNSAFGEHLYWRGCIALNNAMNFGGVGAAYDDTLKINCVGWHVTDGSLVRGEIQYNHCTLGDFYDNTSPYASIDSYEGYGVVINSIIYGSNNVSALRLVEETDYNVLYANRNDFSNTTIGEHNFYEQNSNAIDPIDGEPGNGIAALKYLPRIEDGSDLDGAASDGGDIGATVLYKTGRSGTLWGEEGYNETTNEPLWPFPNEDLIKEKMSAYTYDQDGDGSPEITGKRGFCADGSGLYGGRITLTSYIWEYLGNPCPVDVCNYYDVNRDGHVNISDVQLVVNHILGNSTAEHADTTGDGSVNIQDVQGVVNVILTGTQG